MIFGTQDSSFKASLSDTQLTSSSTDFKSVFPSVHYATTGKRLLDVTLVLIGLIIVLPLILIMALLVSLDGHAPFYMQERVGRNGRRFKIIKMRTMVCNAERILEENLRNDPELRAEWSLNQKIKKDERVTAIGKVLRATSLDELPQLLNVLLGSMSLVGPRPMMPCQEHLYPGKAYYELRPGITGFWQISGRNKCEFRDRSKYDAAYLREVSLKTDIAVLWRTIAVVLRRTGC